MDIFPTTSKKSIPCILCVSQYITAYPGVHISPNYMEIERGNVV